LNQGVAVRVPIKSVKELAEVIGALNSSQMLTLGCLRRDLPNMVKVLTVPALARQPCCDTIARSQEYLIYDGPAFVLLDHDTKGMPATVRARLEQEGGIWNALRTVVPGLADAARVVRASTSSGLWRDDTGEKIGGSDGLHIFIPVKDGADATRFLQALFDRCWLAGLGWIMLSKSGALLKRSIVDRIVGGPEHPVFEGAPILQPPLQQDAESRQPVAIEGKVLDTHATCPSLSAVEQQELVRLQTAACDAIAPERRRVQLEFIEREVARLITRGKSERAARQTVKQYLNYVLHPEVVLEFDNSNLSGSTVADVLDDPDRFEGETLADPHEGVEYGRCKAKIMRKTSGTLFIHSFAHGGCIYQMQYDFDAVKKFLEGHAKEDVATAFLSLLGSGVVDVDEICLAVLKQLTHELSGVGKRDLNAGIKAAKAKCARQDAADRQARQLARRQDRRPYRPMPFPDAESLPVMQMLNDILGKADPPPCRDIDDDLMKVRRLRLPDLHAFSSRGANAEENESERLPPPEQWVMSKLDPLQAEEMIERYVEFYVQDDEGNQRSVQLPAVFVGHYMRRGDNALPNVAAIVTAPLVLADGSLLAPDGLDRERGIEFIIPDELRAALPKPEDCTDQQVKAAMQFLTNEWLCDVATGFTGRAIIVTFALTLMERTLLPDRPALWVIAGERGNGKTTLLIMLIMAVLGLRPAASAWSTDENERRKALMSQLLWGAAYILWDNIPRGLQIHCPHIERSCTTAYYADRRLGVSEIATAASAVVHLFTGNNIAPKADLASRSLEVRLDADRIDPENRAFRHPDPVGWTEANRGRLLKALYTILLGNSQLRTPADAPAKTRFKLWWRLCGSAVEHAAKLCGETIDFKAQFLAMDASEEESTSVSDMIRHLEQWTWAPTAAELDELVKELNGGEAFTYPFDPKESKLRADARKLFEERQAPERLRRDRNGEGRWFTAADVARRLNTDHDEETTAVVEVLYPSAAQTTGTKRHRFSPQGVSKALKRHLDRPVRIDDGRVVALRAEKDTDSKISRYRVVTLQKRE
jgi:hypothetical protein